MSARRRRAGVVAFLGSLLLFTIELIAAKLLLPSFGGSAQVWTTCMVFFQAALLAGYLYARLSTALLPSRLQAWLHLAALTASAWAAFPLHLSVVGHGSPVARLLGALTLSIGGPFIVLSATVPVVQSWSSGPQAQRGTDPYILYASSNAGALAGLLAYPFVVEPLLPVTAQLWAWQGCFALFALLHLACLPPVGGRPPQAGLPLPAVLGVTPEGRMGTSGAARWCAWLALSAGPSAALLAATRFLSDALTAVPLLWVVPLAVYLSTFILTFKREPLRLSGRALGVSAAAVALPLAAAWAAGAAALAGVALNVAALFFLAMICHGSLAASKPAQGHAAPTFYLLIATGGLAGGVLMGVILPLLGRGIGWLGLEWLVAGLACLASLVARDWESWSRSKAFKPAALAFLAVLLAAGWAVSRQAGGGTAPAALRNFYGIYRIVDGDGLRKFYHGNTLHGMQSLDPAKSGEPLAYFHRLSPAGDVFRTLGAGLREVAIVGLGVGALAAYGRPGAGMTFYELDPDVESLARRHFSFLADSPARVRVVTGDARLSLAREPPASYDLLVLDAFNSGAVPTHLLTAEAFVLYLRRLAKDGVILCNISNRFLDMRPLLAALSKDLGLAGVVRHAEPPRGLEREFYPCRWAALSRDPAKIRELARIGWTDLSVYAPPRVRAWTDDHASILPLIRF
ncbi:MAG: fused MFS/spermidine synthase [Elusimicrobia bacterium]|nr:fused MFS/spermidine synthase [Elusimicrobiota bacterium]